MTAIAFALTASLTSLGLVHAQEAHTGPSAATQSSLLPDARSALLPGAQSGVLPSAQGSPPSGASGATPPAVRPIGMPASTYSLETLVNTPTLSPGALTLLELDGRFSQSVATGGGAAFVQWFADDAVTLNNGKPPVQGRGNIAASATWKPADYQLTWSPKGASMGPLNDMGYTWGSYEGRARDANGQTVTTAGRYITIWRKQTDGQWKIALEASADDAPGDGACCALAKP